MDDLDQKEIAELVKTLPTSIQEAINHSNWAMKLSVIAKRHNLMLDQMSLLEKLVFLIMLGVINPKEIDKEMAEIGIKSDQINSLVTEIEQEIFQKIKSELIDNFEKLESLEDEEIAPSVKNPLERDSILKEIEDHDDSHLPATQINIPVPAKTPQIPTTSAQIPVNPVAQNLQTPTVSAPTTMKIDPYREIPE
jgi:hypothetical protein